MNKTIFKTRPSAYLALSLTVIVIVFASFRVIGDAKLYDNKTSAGAWGLVAGMITK